MLTKRLCSLSFISWTLLDPMNCLEYWALDCNTYFPKRNIKTS